VVTFRAQVDAAPAYGDSDLSRHVCSETSLALNKRISPGPKES
jgi:hypothetical protein